MSVLSPQKKKPALLLLAAFLAAGAFLFRSHLIDASADEQAGKTVADRSEANHADRSDPEQVESFSSAASAAPAALTAAAAHAEDCAHCASPAAGKEKSKTESQRPAITELPEYDSIFKNISNERMAYSRSDFDFLTGSHVGQPVRFELAGRQFSGEVALVREGNKAKAYAVTLPEGTLTVTQDTVGEFKAILMLRGDSRAVELADLDENLRNRVNQVVDSKSQSNSDSELSDPLIATQISVSDYICGPKDLTYPLNASEGVPAAGLRSLTPVKAASQLQEPAAAISLTDNPGTGHVLYLDFDGETVTDDYWNFYTGIESLAAAPAPRVNDDAWVTAVWKRVVEDYAPFDITVTTDRSVFDAADPQQRLQAIITPTDTALRGTGGVAFRNSYANNLTRIVWVFNLLEYDCASTVSHEAGHAFGLSHDYASTDNDEYYPGHNGSYTPGWGAIMGAPFQGALRVEVDQWSKGEFENSVNPEDDIQIIARLANGFGFKEDDYANVFTGSGGLDVGFLATTGLNTVGAVGLISRQTDVDVFRFSVAFSGELSMTVNPIDVESPYAGVEPGSNTKGANLAVATRLLNASGTEIAVGVNAGSVELASIVTANLEPGIYYIEVTGAGRGANPTTGFSDYASLGQYEIIADLPTPPLDVYGSSKLDQPVLAGDTSTSFVNGTNYGFSFPSNSAITRTFRLENTGSSALTNVSVSFASGVDFKVISPPPTTIPGGTSVFMQLAYDPLQAGVNGIDTDTVTIDYDTIEPISFSFAVSGYSTLSATKDNYEDNNASKNATNLNGVEDIWLSDYMGPGFFLSDRDDFYTFNVNNDELVTVTVSYDATEGPITFELRNGRADLIGSTTTEDGVIRFRVPTNYTSLHKTFYIKASTAGDSSVRNAYDLRWSSILLTAGEDDLYEENDTFETAFDLTGGASSRLSEYLGLGISKDEDWYKIVIPEDPFIRMLYVRAEFVHADGNIDIELIPEAEIANEFNPFDPFGFFDQFFFDFFADRLFSIFGIYGLAGAEEDYEVLNYSRIIDLDDLQIEYSPINNNSVMGVEPGIYYIRVTGDFAGNEYDLVVEPRREDKYEVVNEVDGIENDTRSNAFDLGGDIIGKRLSQVDGIGILAGYADSATKENLIMTSDADWYRFQVPGNTPIEQLIFQYETIGAGLVIFNLYDENGNLLRESTETSGTVTTLFFSGTETIVRPAGRIFYVRALPWLSNDYLTAYDFRVEVSTEPPTVEDAVDDNYEENDNFTEAYDLRGNANFWLTAVNGYGVHLDPDWYDITIPAGVAELTVLTTFDGEEGNMDLTLSRKDGPVLFRIEDDPPVELDDGTVIEPVTANSREIIWRNPDPGEYAITITGDRRGNLYNLFWGYSLLDDSYEENDSLAAAKDLTGHEKQLLSKLSGPGIQADEDWYRVFVPAGTAELQVVNTFRHNEGDIDLEIYNSAGFLIARSVSVTSNEAITLANPMSDDYFIRVYYGNNSNEYDLWWGAFTQQELDAIDTDAYEPNNIRTEQDATTLPRHTSLRDLDGLATQTDVDWYVVEVTGNNSGFLVECDFIHADGDIDIEFVDFDGAVLVRSSSRTDNEVIDYNAPLPVGIYYIRVYGANLGNSYDLLWVDKLDDGYEDNDSPATAFDITDLRQTLLSETAVPTQGDDDWYRFTANDANSILVLELTHTNSNGSIQFEVYDSNGTRLASNLTADDLKYLQYALPSAGNFFIRVFGDDAYNEYDLFWNALPDDEYEENDIKDDAHVITADEGVDLAGVLFDADWFKINPPDGAVRVTLSLNFDASDGDIDLSVFNKFGEPVVEIPNFGDTGSVTFEVDPFDGENYIQLTGSDRDYGNTYTLNWVTVTRDIGEDNDTLETATDLSALEGIPLSEGLGFATSGDEDWYSIVPSGSNLSVYCRFVNAAGNIDIELTDSSGNTIERSISDDDDESIMTAVTPGDTYYIRVFGQTAGNPYDLVWNSYDADDSFEENDDLATAGDLVPVEYQSQDGLVQLDDDWYEIEVAVGESLLIAEIDPVARIDAMVLGLYKDASTLLQSVATANAETRIEASSLSAGTYYLRVSGQNIGGEYSLVWSSGNEDKYEENDDLGTAAPDLSSSPSTQLSVIGGELGAQYDEDWYSVTLATNDNTLSATLDFVHNEGNLNLTLIDSQGNELITSDGATDTETISLDGLDAGVYYLRVNGPNTGNVYDLLWTAYADDNYEDNDDFDESYDLGNSVSGSLSAIDDTGVRGSDDDWFKLSVPVGYVTLEVNCIFNHVDANIDLELFDGEQASLAIADSADDNESISVSVDPNGETIYILVKNGLDSGATYDLTWTFGAEDLYEDDDTTATATDITANAGTLLSELTGYGTQTDSDFYLVTLPVNSRTLNVDVLFDHSLGDIDVKVYDSVPTEIGSANSTTNDETLAVNVDPAGGDYYIEVTGKAGTNSGNHYDLIWSVDVDDPYEENDDNTAPYDLTAASNGVALSADLGEGILYDEDWYRLTTPAGDFSLKVLIDGFDVIDGDINLEVYDSANTLLASSIDGVTSNEVIVPVDPENAAGETFKIRVFGDGAGNSYDLTWSTSTEDVYEENDFVEDAYDLSGLEGVWISTETGFGSQSDDDWYQIVVSTGATTLTINCDFIHAEGDIDLELYRLDSTTNVGETLPGVDERKPTLVSRVTSTSDDEEIIFTDAAGITPGIYFIRVYFGNQGNQYDLRWNDGVAALSGDLPFLSEGWSFSEDRNINITKDSRLLTPLANADGDAFPNWAEYAFDLNADIADTVVVDNSQQEIDGKTYFTISFIRKTEAVVAGYQYYVDESSDLSFAGSRLAEQVGQPEALGGGLERVTYRCSNDMTASPQCFFRIRVEAPEKAY